MASYATASSCLPGLRSIPLQSKSPASPDSMFLRFQLPSSTETLAERGIAPSGISVVYKEPVSGIELKKSYSPISLPDEEGSFELLVKAYPPREGGGVGAHLCGLEPGDVAQVEVKPPRLIHGSTDVARRWAKLGMVCGGTGVTPFLQIIRHLLATEGDETEIWLLSVNRNPEDILMRAGLEAMAAK